MDPDPKSTPLTPEPLPLRLSSITLRCMWGNHAVARQNVLALFAASAETLTTLRLQLFLCNFESTAPKGESKKQVGGRRQRGAKHIHDNLDRLVVPGFKLVAPRLLHLEFTNDAPPPKTLALVGERTALQSIYADYKVLVQLFPVLPPQLSRIILSYDAALNLPELLDHLYRPNLVNVSLLDFQTKESDPVWTDDGRGGPKLLQYCQQEGIMVRYSGDFVPC